MSCTMFSCKLLQIGHTDFQGIWPSYMQRWNRSRSGPEFVAGLKTEGIVKFRGLKLQGTTAMSWFRWRQCFWPECSPVNPECITGNKSWMGHQNTTICITDCSFWQEIYRYLWYYYMHTLSDSSKGIPFLSQDTLGVGMTNTRHCSVIGKGFISMPTFCTYFDSQLGGATSEKYKYTHIHA